MNELSLWREEKAKKKSSGRRKKRSRSSSCKRQGENNVKNRNGFITNWKKDGKIRGLKLSNSGHYCQAAATSLYMVPMVLAKLASFMTA